ncbi:hypothetical protein [Parageobacillus toebii]|uniref:hypothetical protein n=1 Tax=Parageobacillus toebii TaxID=153151 RepID=UPI002E2271FB|nr:hypothetical protein [Parageobacillus toebii]
MKEYGKKAGIKNVRCSPHTFRHTFLYTIFFEFLIIYDLISYDKKFAPISLNLLFVISVGIKELSTISLLTVVLSLR